MSKRRINKFYEQYPKYFRDFSREYIKKVGRCEFEDETCKGKLTIAHIDQNPNNNKLDNIKVLYTSHHIRFDQPFHVTSMGTNSKKTDNSHLEEKVLLRLETVNKIKKDKITVLEAYAGDGKIWEEVQKRTDKKIQILKIEKKNDKKGVYLKGDNLKFIPLFDYSIYDIIDFDAYGVPYHQLETIFKNKYKGYVHVTFIQSGMGNLPNDMLVDLGYTKGMIKKCRTLFSKNGLEKMKRYLAINGVNKIDGYFFDRKSYFYFKVDSY